MRRRRTSTPARQDVDPIGTALVHIGDEILTVPLLRATSLGEALVRLPGADRWVPSEWWASV